MIPAIVSLLLAAGMQQPAAAPQDGPAATDTRSAEERIARSASLGRLLYVHDRAAWVASDALTAAIPADQVASVGGYVVEMSGDNSLRVTFYRGEGDAARAFFVADVRNGKVAQKQLLATPVPLTAAQATLARARTVAAAQARQRSYKPCTPAPFNTVVLPSQNDGPVAVYLLTAQQDAATYPMGGNYRVIVGADGTALSARQYSVSCVKLTVPKGAGARPAGLVISHLLDPVPTEIHVFASYTLGVPLFVVTPDKRLWQVRGSSITPVAVK